MPNVLIPITVSYESITRRMVHSVVEEVMQKTGLSTNIPIRFYGNLGKNYQPGSTLDPTDTNFVEGADKITISVSEDYRDNTYINSPVRQGDAKPIFEDPALEILIKPVYSQTNVSIEFVYRADSQAEVVRWRDDVRTRAADGRQAFLHELTYHYPVPPYCLVVLHHLYDLREAQAGYGDTYQEWLKKCFTNNATTLTNMSGQKSLLVIGERQVGVQGWFDFDQPPKEEKGEDATTWSITFTYQLVYDKALEVNFLYPLVVHNQFIDDKFYSSDRPYSLDDRPRLASDSKEHFDRLSDLFRKPADPMGGLRVPDFDEWTPEVVPTYTTSFVTWMMQVDQTDGTLLLDLDELDDYELDPDFRKFLDAEQQYITRRGESLITFNLFCNLLPMTEPCLTLDGDMVVRATEPMNLRSLYHLRMGAVVEYGLFTERALEAMQEHGTATLKIFQTILPDLDVEYAQSKFVGTRMPLWYIRWFFRYLRERREGDTGKGIGGGSGGVGPGLTGGYYIDWPLVSILTIIAKRKGVTQ